MKLAFAKFDIFKKMWPDLDDEQIKEMVDRKFEEEKRKLEMTAEINAKAFEKSMQIKGDFGNDEKKKEEIDNMSDKTEAHKDNKLK